jgi:hypothetical protein
VYSIYFPGLFGENDSRKVYAFQCAPYYLAFFNVNYIEREIINKHSTQVLKYRIHRRKAITQIESCIGC